ncbi:uncharacterized protein LOC128736160 [Sabethes cyaneus]|uniref:uncharacterized protein LOC128736160 n=1 Tax=Sabethes cyaneus TaxID=53552 RepID=UPI00237DDFF7|nr:uncharacterized protein LOC128736160 [Sabethes cyaneus]
MLNFKGKPAPPCAIHDPSISATQARRTALGNEHSSSAKNGCGSCVKQKPDLPGITEHPNQSPLEHDSNTKNLENIEFDTSYTSTSSLEFLDEEWLEEHLEEDGNNSSSNGSMNEEVPDQENIHASNDRAVRTNYAEQELIEKLRRSLNDNREEIRYLTDVVSKQEEVITGFRYDLKSFVNDDTKVKLLTGLPSYSLLCKSPKMANQVCKYSSKISKLNEADISRYHEKILAVDGTDPYQMEYKSDILPLTIDYDRIFAYLISRLSFRTGAPHRNMKSLDAYKSFQSGFVKDVKGCKYKEVFVITGQVLHSLSINQPPAECWVIINDAENEEHTRGEILAAHCDCTAGAGETCTHIAAVLYALSYAREICLGKKLSVTELPSYWMVPGGSAATEDLYKPIDSVNFGRKRETFCELRDYALSKTEEEVRIFLDNVTSAGHEVVARRAFFMSTDAEQENVSIKDRLLDFSFVKRFSNENHQKTLEDLINIGKTIDWSTTIEDCRFIEEMTRKQHAEPMWFMLRYGRITASIFSRCLRTSLSKPSKSLLTCIFSQNQGQYFPATLHGRRNEHKGVIAAVEDFKCNDHINVRHRKSGLTISPEHPYFAASPDYIIQCDCCGTIVIEVKCPFKFDLLTRDEGIEALLSRHSSYLLRNSSGVLTLNPKHPYFYQVQMQILVANAAYGLFVVWAPRFTLAFNVEKDTQFWVHNYPKAKLFFENVLAPEILGHYFSLRN